MTKQFENNLVENINFGFIVNTKHNNCACVECTQAIKKITPKKGRCLEKGVNDLATLSPDIAAEWNYELNKKGPDEYTCGSGQKVYFTCFTCGYGSNGEWKAEIKSRTNGRGCPVCAGKAVYKGVNDLATLRPDIAAEWNYELNKKGPDEYTCGTDQKVYFTCSTCGYGSNGEWKASINNRTNGRGCPVCAGQVVYKGVNDLATLYPNIAAEWNYELNKKGPDEYTCGSNKKVYFTCSTCGYGSNGEWKASINKRTNGKGCPVCAGKAVYKGVNDLATLSPDIAAEWNYELNEKGPDEYTCGSGQKVYFTCFACGYGSNGEWKAEIAKRTGGCGCPVCAGQVVYKGVNDLATLYPNIAAEWNYELNKKGPDEYTCGTGQKVYFTCSTCGYGSNGEWKAVIGSRTSGRGCPACVGKAVYKGVNDLATLYPNIAAEWNYKLNKKGPDEYTYGSGQKVYFTCSTCGYGSNGEWKASINSRTSGSDCPKCSSSKGEKIITQILKGHNIDFKKEFTFNDCIYKGPLRFDFAIFNSKGELVKLIEYDGIQHFEPVNFGGMSDERALEEHKLTKKRDKIKNTYCKKNNISLLRIKYTEFSNLEEIITNLLKELKLI